MMRFVLVVLLTVSTLPVAASLPPPAQEGRAGDSLRLAEEKHLANIRQLTFGGENAEA